MNRNSSINMGFNPYGKDGESKPINVFVELAEESNDKNDDYININILQRGQSSISKPYMLKDKSALSNFSMNVLTGNEVFQNPVPIKIKQEEPMKRPVLENNLHEDITNDKSQPNTDSCPSKSFNIKTDSGDYWVKCQEKMYDQLGYNWNQEVEVLLEDDESVNEPQEEPETPQAPKVNKPIKNDRPPNVNIRRHRKKSQKQLEILESHFDIDKEWSLELVERLAAELCLEKDQVYKWNWDKRKRLRKKAERECKAQGQMKKKNKRQKTH